MKSFVRYSLGLLFVSIILYSISFSQAKKYVLFEHFTSDNCGPCASQNPIFDSTILEKNHGNIIHIAYHTSWPSGNEPMNAYSATEVLYRVAYYNVTGVPYMVMLGNKLKQGPALYLQKNVDIESSYSSPISIRVSETSDGTQRNVRIVVNTYGELPSGNYKLRALIVEKEIKYGSAPGSNGESTFPDVFRKALPDINGDFYTPTLIGDSTVYNYKYTLDTGVWDTTQIFVAAFIQDDVTKEVINAGSSLDPQWGLTSEFNFQKVNSGQPNNFQTSLNNWGKNSERFKITLTKDQPSDWTASFKVDNQDYNDEANVSVDVNSLKKIDISAIPGNMKGVGNYKLIIKSLDNPEISPQVALFNVISGVTDLIINNDGSWGSYSADTTASTFKDNYIDGLKSAGVDALGVTTTQIFNIGMKSGMLDEIKKIYFNVGWSFPSFTDENVIFFSKFLDNAGNLFVCGQDIGWEISDTVNSSFITPAKKAFYKKYMKSTFVSDGNTLNNKLISNTDDELFKDVNTTTIKNVYGSGTNGPYMYPEVITPTSEGRAIFYYDNAHARVGAVRSLNDKYKMVYLGVSLEMLADADVRYSILEITNKWFNAAVSVEEFDNAMAKIMMGQNYPNPVVDYTIIPVDNIIKDATIEIVDLTGRILQNLKIMAGTNNIRVNTTDFEPGMYFYRIIDDKGLIENKTMIVVH